MSAQPWQPSLLGGLGAPARPLGFDADLTGLRRIALDSVSWLDYLPGWLDGQAILFEHLRDHIHWHSSKRQMYEQVVAVPRLTASVPRDGAGHPVLPRLRSALEARYATRFDRLVLAYYRDGNDSVAWHRDRLADRSDSLVAIVSVGERRRFLLRPFGGGGTALTLTVGWGDLLVMGGATQSRWEHCVPKERAAGPRMAIMFRRAFESR